MGRGRAKAKQAKVARQLKYNSGGTDLSRLAEELGASPSNIPPNGQPFEDDDDEQDDDPYARYADLYGEDEDDSLCPDPALKDTEVVRTGGGHHFDGDYDAIAARILDGARRRAGLGASTSPPPR